MSNKEIAKRWREKNPNYSKNYRKANIEKMKVLEKKVREKRTALYKEYYQTNIEQRKKYDKQYRKENATILHNQNKIYRKANPEIFKAGNAKWKKMHPIQKLLVPAKYRSTKKNIPYDIIDTDIFMPTHCPILGLELNYQGSKRGPNAASLDRIIPSLGYVKGNVEVISWRANRIKSDATPKELKLLADYYSKYIPL